MSRSAHVADCPITLEPLRDPVRAPSGQVYEREAILLWLKTESTDPLTRAPLQTTDLKTARDVLRLVNLAAASNHVIDLTQGGDLVDLVDLT